MRKQLFMTLITAISFSAFANSDLSIDGARWEAKNLGYKCDAFTDESEGPIAHQNHNVKFETLVTDKTLDNGLVKATFNEEGETCRYSAILFADNAASTIKLVDSKAYSTNGKSNCSNGKAILDTSLAMNDYLYWGHPHHVTIMMPAASAASICGAGATHIGLDFVVSKFLGQRN